MVNEISPPVCPTCGELGSFVIKAGRVLDGGHLPWAMPARCPKKHEWIAPFVPFGNNAKE